MSEFWKCLFIGIRVGHGNGAAGVGGGFERSMVYFIATFHPIARRLRLAVVWTVNND